MDKFLNWMSGAASFMAALFKGDAAKTIIAIILGIIRQVQATGKSGADKRAIAFTLLVAALPEIIEVGVKLMKDEDAGGCPGDKDCDGIPDAVDPCPDGPCPPAAAIDYPPNGARPVSGCVLPDGTVDWGCDGK